VTPDASIVECGPAARLSSATKPPSGQLLSPEPSPDIPRVITKGMIYERVKKKIRYTTWFEDPFIFSCPTDKGKTRVRGKEHWINSTEEIMRLWDTVCQEFLNEERTIEAGASEPTKEMIETVCISLCKYAIADSC
jgi:hypothetical protein